MLDRDAALGMAKAAKVFTCDPFLTPMVSC